MLGFYLRGALIAIITALIMEGVAYATHRFVMHGVGWRIHRSHHRTRRGFWELNDAFGLVFAAMSIAAIVASNTRQAVYWVGIGMALYGLLYALLHDGLVHRRFRFVRPPRTGYLSRLVKAHHIHHAVKTRDGAVSFGFLYAPPVDRLSRALRDRSQA
jgi:beta-carotene 3-hydroxylase